MFHWSCPNELAAFAKFLDKQGYLNDNSDILNTAISFHSRYKQKVLMENFRRVSEAFSPYVKEFYKWAKENQDNDNAVFESKSIKLWSELCDDYDEDCFLIFWLDKFQDLERVPCYSVHEYNWRHDCYDTVISLSEPKQDISFLFTQSWKEAIEIAKGELLY